MARKANTTRSTPTEPLPKEPETSAPPPPKEPKAPVEYGVAKYLELFQPDMHPYTRSYVTAYFRGKMGTKSDWDAKIGALTEATT